ncbi:MAG: hypothetical protein OEO82_06895 [Gammaproteobacteria bacterium]|nr:hypothetical protein [Gammaproteobacteria bacterium]
MKHSRLIIRIIVLMTVSVATVVHGDDSETVFARVAEAAEGQAQALQLAIVTYVPAHGATDYSVDLVSAIHIGEAQYYAELNDRFTAYDALLYELVAPQGTVVTRETERRGFVSGAQLMLTRALDLSFQLDEIDYTRANFVHADLSAKELAESMADRNESLYTYFWRVFFASMREYSRDPLGLADWRLLAAMVKSDGDAALKTMLAHELTDLDRIQEVLGEDSDSAVIGARNERAIEVLHRQLDAGATRIGIFYGVGHMPDLEARLLAMGLRPERTAWIDAWDLGAE